MGSDPGGRKRVLPPWLRSRSRDSSTGSAQEGQPMSRLRLLLVLVGALALTAFVAHRTGPDDPWEHIKHEKLFPKCQTCHPGALDPNAAMWPKAESCAECHDGKVEDRVNWKEPAAKPAGNLKFTHDRHAREVRDSLGADSTVVCMQCHAETGAK
ncbi:MAG: hypothetical protein E4H38_02305, partial [Gemmatimonadales bacterium]